MAGSFDPHELIPTLAAVLHSARRMLYRSSIDPFIHRKITVLHQDVALHDAARAMREKGQGCVFVADHQGFVVGVVTDRDIACRAVAEQLPTDAPLAQVMTPTPAHVAPNATIDEVVRLMEENGVRRIPVLEIDPQGRSYVVGLVTLDDLMAGEMVDTFRLSRIIRGQVRRRVGEFAHQRGRVTSMFDGQGRVVTDEEVLSRFFFEIHLRSGAEKLGLSPEQTEGITRELLRTLISRVHHTAARHILAHLPPTLEEEWEDDSHGPDRRATLERLQARVRDDGWCHVDNCREAIMAVGRAWASLLPADELALLRGQLPPEFSAMLLPPEDFERRRWTHVA